MATRAPTMDKDETHTIHALYSALHAAHKSAPSIWTMQECTRVLTAIMAAKAFSWRVIGITPRALHSFSMSDFRIKSRQGITRAHLRPRIETVRAVILPAEPLSEKALFETWLANDTTVLCAKGENRETIPTYIPIDNELGALFSCRGKLAGWHHRRAEQELLRALHDIHAQHPPPSIEEGKAAPARKTSRVAHNKGKPNYLHSVEVGDTRYRSAWAAWKALQICASLPERSRISECVKFRGKLKRSRSGRLDYVDPITSKTYTFRLIPYNSRY